MFVDVLRDVTLARNRGIEKLNDVGIKTSLSQSMFLTIQAYDISPGNDNTFSAFLMNAFSGYAEVVFDVHFFYPSIKTEHFQAPSRFFKPMLRESEEIICCILVLCSRTTRQIE